MTNAETALAELAELRKQCPDMSIIHSSADRWWAFRPAERGRRSQASIDVDADTPEQLRARIVAAL
ncbi:hypothetical protein ACFQ07_04460, partial [Actinomadura adrarensis]